MRSVKKFQQKMFNKRTESHGSFFPGGNCNINVRDPYLCWRKGFKYSNLPPNYIHIDYVESTKNHLQPTAPQEVHHSSEKHFA